VSDCSLELENAFACQEDSQPWLEEFSSFLDIRPDLVGEQWKNFNSSLFGDTFTLPIHRGLCAQGRVAADAL
jgi:hypothetical protein